MSCTALSAGELAGHQPTDHQIEGLPTTGETFTLIEEQFGLDTGDAPIYSDPALVAAYARGLVEGRALAGGKGLFK